MSQSIENKATVNQAQIKTDTQSGSQLLAKFPWIAPWHIDACEGLQSLINDLLFAIEAIAQSNGSLVFLKITETEFNPCNTYAMAHLHIQFEVNVSEIADALVVAIMKAINSKERTPSISVARLRQGNDNEVALIKITGISHLWNSLPNKERITDIATTAATPFNVVIKKSARLLTRDGDNFSCDELPWLEATGELSIEMHNGLCGSISLFINQLHVFYQKNPQFMLSSLNIKACLFGDIDSAGEITMLNEPSFCLVFSTEMPIELAVLARKSIAVYESEAKDYINLLADYHLSISKNKKMQLDDFRRQAERTKESSGDFADFNFYRYKTRLIVSENLLMEQVRSFGSPELLNKMLGELKAILSKSAEIESPVESPIEPAIESLIKTHVELFDNERVSLMLKDNEAVRGERSNYLRRILNGIAASGNKKRLATIGIYWAGRCDQMEAAFPNFSEVIHLFRGQMALSGVGDGVLRLPPILLVGEPGIGKTEFALTLAETFGTILDVIDMASAQTGSALTGSESYWANSEVGRLFKLLASGSMANPIILLDEIDKARNSREHDPLAGLYSLLEPRQAKKFRDLSLTDLELDASHVIWIATANNLASIDAPIISRLTVFNINPPTRDEMRVITENQYQRFIDRHPSGSFFEACARQEVLDAVGSHPPRLVRKLLEKAFGFAAFEKRNYLLASDIRSTEVSSGMGFVRD